MLDSADRIWELLQQDAAVYVCGNASTIAPGVRRSLTRIFADKTGAGDGRRPGVVVRAALRGPLRRGHLGRVTPALRTPRTG